MSNKILFILHLPPPIHGAAMVGKYIQDSKTINGAFDTKYINLSTSRSIDEIGKGGLKKWWRYFGVIRKTISQIILFRPNYVYLTLTAKGVGFYKDALVVIVAKMLGAKMVFHFHNKGIVENQHIKLDNWLYKLVFKNAKVILLSPYLYSDIEKYVAKKNVLYCANGIPEIKGDIDKKKASITPELLFISNLMESKGVFVLLDAIEIVKSNNELFHCTIIGDEGDINKERLQQEISKRQLDANVNYVGKQTGTHKINFLKSADIFIHPTLNDCFPLVLIEAMQFSLPVVSTFEGAIPEIVENGKTGFLVNQKDAVALAEKIELLINNVALRNEMGQAGYEKFKKEYTLTSFETNFTAILKSLN